MSDCNCPICPICPICPLVKAKIQVCNFVVKYDEKNSNVSCISGYENIEDSNLKALCRFVLNEINGKKFLSVEERECRFVLNEINGKEFLSGEERECKQEKYEYFIERMGHQYYKVCFHSTK